MSNFTPAEIAYLQSQRLGRLATVDAAGNPHVVPVAFRYNPELETIDVGGHGIARSKKYRDVAHSGRAAFVVDDLASVDPWRPRMLEVRGRAEVVATGGQEIMPAFDPELIRIFPPADRRVWRRRRSDRVQSEQPHGGVGGRRAASMRRPRGRSRWHRGHSPNPRPAQSRRRGTTASSGLRRPNTRQRHLSKQPSMTNGRSGRVAWRLPWGCC